MRGDRQPGGVEGQVDRFQGVRSEGCTIDELTSAHGRPQFASPALWMPTGIPLSEHPTPCGAALPTILCTRFRTNRIYFKVVVARRAATGSSCSAQVKASRMGQSETSLPLHCVTMALSMRSSCLSSLI